MKQSSPLPDSKDDLAKTTFKPIRNKKSPKKLSNVKEYDLMTFIETDTSSGKLSCPSDFRNFNAMDISVNYLRNSNKHKKSAKDVVMVKKIQIRRKEKYRENQNQNHKQKISHQNQKQNQLSRISSPVPQVPTINQRIATECKLYLFDSLKKNQSYFSLHPYFKRNETQQNIFNNIKVNSKYFLKNQNRTKTIKLQNINKKQNQPQQQVAEKYQKSSMQSLSKADNILNDKLNSYLNCIKEIRKSYSFVQELPSFYKKRCLRAKIGPGNNSYLIRQLIKKRWWWTIDDDKQCKKRPNFFWTQLKDKKFYVKDSVVSEEVYSHNHFQLNQYLGNKKALLYNMSFYYEKKGQNTFDFLPLTFHVQEHGDQAWKKFIAKYQQNSEKNMNNIWILKPGENSNRGKGITVHQSLSQIQKIVQEGGNYANAIDPAENVGKKSTFIIQTYLDKPFLYNKRKFDIRCYMLLVNLNGKMKGYWYREGYIRTSSFEFQLANFDTYVHLTNDAIQNNSESYGKYQEGNKVSYQQFQKYLDSKHAEEGFNFEREIIPKMKSIALDTIKAAQNMIKGQCTRPVFELFGLDFMIDEKFNPWLIEVNTNPCLETCSQILERMIPKLVDDTFKITLDIVYPPPEFWPSSRRHFIPSSITNYELFYEQETNQEIKSSRDLPSLGVITEDDEVYDEK